MFPTPATARSYHLGLRYIAEDNPRGLARNAVLTDSDVRDALILSDATAEFWDEVANEAAGEMDLLVRFNALCLAIFASESGLADADRRDRLQTAMIHHPDQVTSLSVLVSRIYLYAPAEEYGRVTETIRSGAQMALRKIEDHAPEFGPMVAA